MGEKYPKTECKQKQVSPPALQINNIIIMNPLL